MRMCKKCNTTKLNSDFLSKRGDIILLRKSCNTCVEKLHTRKATRKNLFDTIAYTTLS